MHLTQMGNRYTLTVYRMDFLVVADALDVIVYFKREMGATKGLIILPTRMGLTALVQSNQQYIVWQRRF